MTFAAVMLASAVFSRALERVDSMEPPKSQSAYDSRAIQLVYETPLEIDYRKRPYALAPGVCELPEVSPDGLQYTLRMVRGAVPRARDVARAIERLRDPANPSPGSWTMKCVSKVECLGDDALRVVLSRRQHVFPWMLAMSYCGVVLEDGSGSGPYRLESWWRNHEMTFVRNPGWRGWARTAAADAAAGLVPYEKIRYLVVDDVSTRWLMFLSGEIDFLGDIARDNWSVVMDPGGNIHPALAKKGIRLYGGDPAMEIRYLGINMRDAVLGKNKKLRQALTCAFDFPTWKAFYNNSVEKADGPVPPGVEGCLGEPPPYPYDLERAKKLLAEAGYPGGIDPATGRRLTLALSIGRPSQDSREAGELVSSFYAKAGIRLELRFQTWDAFLNSVNKGDAQLFMLAWVGDYPDPENFLQLFHSSNLPPGSNHSNYVNPAFDAEYDAAMAELDPRRRNLRWAECQRIVREDCPCIFTHISRNFSLSGPGLENYVPGDFPYGAEKNFRTRKAPAAQAAKAQ